MDFKRVTLNEQPYLFIEKTVPMAEMGSAMASSLPALFGFLGQNGIAPQSMPMSIYLGEPGPTMTFRSAVFVSAEDAAKASGEVRADVLPACDAMTTTHVGPYDKLGATHQALWGYMGEQGLTGGAVWEIYVDDPQSTAPDQLRTEIFCALT